MRIVLTFITLFLLLCCSSRKIDKQKNLETKKIEISETKKENIKKVEFSQKEVENTVIELDTSNVSEITIDYIGKKEDQIEINKEHGKLIIKGSGKISIQSKKENIRKDKVKNRNITENRIEAKQIISDTKEINKSTTKKNTLNKQTHKNNYSIFYFIVFLLLIASIIYLLKHFKVF